MSKSLEGFSVARTENKYHVYRGDDRVGTISRLGPMFSNLLAWEWHAADMWNYKATEFVDWEHG